MDVSKYDQKVRAKIFLSIIMVVWLSVIVVGYTTTEVTDENSCYREITTCYGLNQGSCLGIEEVNVEIKESCDRKSDIKSICSELNRRSCTENTSRNIQVLDKRCGFWEENLDDFEMQECSGVS